MWILHWIQSYEFYVLLDPMQSSSKKKEERKDVNISLHLKINMVQKQIVTNKSHIIDKGTNKTKINIK